MDVTKDPANSNPGISTYDERLLADVHRAVGGPLNLLRELGRISEHLEPSVPANWLIKRVLFFTYELQSLVDSSSPERDRLAALNKFFFEEKKFVAVTEKTRIAEPANPYTLHKVMSERSGQPLVLAPLYNLLAERLGLKLEIVDFKPSCFLKWVEQGHSRFIDITREGATLSSDELIEILHSRFELASSTAAQALEVFSFESFMIRYVNDLKTALMKSSRASEYSADRLLFLQNILINYQPSNMHWIGERAFLNRKLGNFKSALADLKRYFAFNDRERGPTEYVKLHDELVLLLSRHDGAESEL
jgi:regulator of sirC expression with transglutaminase-like and TPR domain